MPRDMDRAKPGTLTADIENALAELDGTLPAPSAAEVDAAVAKIREAVAVLRNPQLAASIIARHGKRPKKDDVDAE